MKTDALFMCFKLIVLLACAIGLAILITPFNFLILEMLVLSVVFIIYAFSKDIIKVIIIWIVSLVFVEFSKMPLGMDIPNISPDRAIFLFLFIFYLFSVIQGKISLSGRITEALMFILCGLAIFSVIRTRQNFIARDMFGALSLLFNAYISPFFIFLVAKDFINEEKKIRKLFTLLSVILLYLSLTAIFEHFRVDRLVFPKDILNPSLGINFGRARGPFLAASVNGLVLGMLTVLNFYMAINSRMLQRTFFIVNMFLSVIAVFFTYTRAPWLGIVISFAFMIVINANFRKYIVIFILLGIVFIAPLYSKIINVENLIARVNSKGPVDSRITLYNMYLDVIKKKPIMGIGFANFNSCVEEYSSSTKTRNIITHENLSIHDTFFGIFVELGGLGLIVFLSILASIFWKSFILFKHLGEGFLGKNIVVIFWGVGIVYFINAFFIDIKFHQIQNVIFYMTAGIILGLYQRRIRHE